MKKKIIIMMSLCLSSLTAKGLSDLQINTLQELAFYTKIINRCEIYRNRDFYNNEVYKKIYFKNRIGNKIFKISYYDLYNVCNEPRYFVE